MIWRKGAGKPSTAWKPSSEILESNALRPIRSTPFRRDIRLAATRSEDLKRLRALAVALADEDRPSAQTGLRSAGLGKHIEKLLSFRSAARPAVPTSPPATVGQPSRLPAPRRQPAESLPCHWASSAGRLGGTSPSSRPLHPHGLPAQLPAQFPCSHRPGQGTRNAHGMAPCQSMPAKRRKHCRQRRWHTAPRFDKRVPPRKAREALLDAANIARELGVAVQASPRQTARSPRFT